MKKMVITAVFLAFLTITSAAGETAGPALSQEKFNNWPYLPEYTVLNPFPLKGNNCTWFAHGRMMQLGYCTYALNSMRFNAHTWAGDAAYGAVVSDEPAAPSIAFWDSDMFFNSSLGHVAVVEEIREDGSILVSDSSVSGSSYRTYNIKPGDDRWPCAFIIVPKGENRSVKFSPGQKVQTTAYLLYFRLEGANQSSVLLPEDTIARIADHVSNGIYAPRPRSSMAFHYWWYAEADVNGEIKRGWLAETYLEEAPPGSIISTPRVEQEQEDVDEHEQENEPGLEADENSGNEENVYINPIHRTGDVYGDGQVNARDVVLTMQHMMRVEVLNEDQVKAADVNRDGVVDIRDVVLLMQYILRLVDSFE